MKLRVASFVFLLVSGAASVVACGAKDENLPPGLNDPHKSTTPPPGGGGPFDASTDGATDAQACTSIANVAVTVSQMFVGETSPIPMGGTVVSGTYALTAANIYTGVGGNSGPTGLQIQETLNLETSNGLFVDTQIQALTDGGAPIGLLTSGDFTTLGTTLTLQSTCPGPGTQSFGYSVINATVHRYDGQYEYVYTPQ